MSLLAFTLQRTTRIWQRTNSSSSSQIELRKAFSPLNTDLSSTEFQAVRVSLGPSSLVGRDGDAIWFLSAIDPATGEVRRSENGRPFWQRNILYYTVVPNQHQTLFGFTCSGGTDTANYENRCPHKLLIRKVIDNPSGPGPGDGTSSEELLTDITPYLTRPNGYILNSGSEPGLEDATITARNLLTFRVQRNFDPKWPGEISLSLTAPRIEEARNVVRIGTESLDGFLQEFSFSVFPPSEP